MKKQKKIRKSEVLAALEKVAASVRDSRAILECYFEVNHEVEAVPEGVWFTKRPTGVSTLSFTIRYVRKTT